jgi:hypothetical protein
MVGIVEKVTQPELEAARDLLISRQNALPHNAARTWSKQRDYERLELALDLIDGYLKHKAAA